MVKKKVIEIPRRSPPKRKYIKKTPLQKKVIPYVPYSKRDSIENNLPCQRKRTAPTKYEPTPKKILAELENKKNIPPTPSDSENSDEATTSVLPLDQLLPLDITSDVDELAELLKP